MTDNEHANRGRKASEVLDSAIFAEAFNAVRERLLAIMEAAKTDEATLKAKLALGLLADVKQYIEKVAKDGVIATKTIELEAVREEREQKRKWWKVVGT